MLKAVPKEEGVGKFLSTEELEKTRRLHNDLSGLKLQIAEVELQRHSILKQFDLLRIEFANHETELMSKYGSDATINLSTGEVVTNKKDG